MNFFLQYNSSTPVAINSTAAQNFGITNITSLYQAGVDVASQIQKICIPVIGIALLIRLFTFMTKLYNEKDADFLSLGRMALLILFLTEYTEIMTQVNTLISYFTDSVKMMFDQYGSGHTIVDKVNEVYNKYKDSHPDPGLLGGLSGIMDWIIANCTHMIIVVARSVTYIIRSLIMIFLFATGPIAVLFSMFPGFEENLKHWLKYYISVGFWMVSLAVLDLILYNYLQYCEDNDTVDGITTVNIGMALMYLIAPYLTGRYIHAHGSMFMSRMVQSASSMMSISSSVVGGILPGIGYGANRATRLALGKADKGGVKSMEDGGQEGLGKVAGRVFGNIKSSRIGKNSSET